MPENLDPRALKIFCLPDDENAENYIDKYNDIEKTRYIKLRFRLL